MDLGRALSWTAARYPDRLGIAGEHELTYAEWDVRTNRLARGLAQAGVVRGARVALVMSNGEALATTHLAAQKLGARSTPLNTRYTPQELAHCLEDSAPTVCVTDDRTADLTDSALEHLDDHGRGFVRIHVGDQRGRGDLCFESIIADNSGAGLDISVSDDDASVMLYTAGTTGMPKGVPRSQRNEFSAAMAHIVQCRYGPGESTLGAMPMYHTMGLRSLLSMVLIGGTFVEAPDTSPGTLLELCASQAISSLYLVPTVFWRMLDDGGFAEATSAVRKLAFAGAAMPSAMCERLDAQLRPEVFVNHYGCTEVYTFTVEDRIAQRPDSAGRPGIFSRMGVARIGTDQADDGTPEPGELGELIASLDSDEAFSGYWQRPDADRKALRNGWYHTGDLGYVDEDGLYHVAGRVDDMIITGGENVHPLEVEDTLVRSPDVAEAAVVGLSDELWGQAVTAFVSGEQGSEPSRTAESVARFIADSSGLASFKRPKRVVVVGTIPKSPVGKLLRRKLAAGDYSPLAEAAVSGPTKRGAAVGSKQTGAQPR
jgi:2-furoate---CoA ligase